MSAKRILLVTGMSGAGRTTVLKTLEDSGWETADNLPIALVERLLDSPPPEGSEEDRPFAVGIDSRTRGFDSARVLRSVARLDRQDRFAVEILFVDAPDSVLARRYSETRRRHPLALDRPIEDGIAGERELTRPLRDAAQQLIDTGDLSSNALQQEVRTRFAGDGAAPTLVVTSFGFSRGLPRDADLVFDLRFLRNPHWVPELKPGTGLDADVAAFVAGDPAYGGAVGKIEALLLDLVPLYARDGKSYVTVAFGCTGGRHRSVHVADRIGRRLREAGFSPTILHRDLAHQTADATEGQPGVDQRTSVGRQ